jgi:predicted PurR-regulated permease PerM
VEEARVYWKTTPHLRRRFIIVALFLGLLYFFRGLAPVFICFVILARTFGWLGDQIDKRTPLHRTGSIAVVLTIFASALGVLVFLGVRRMLPLIRLLRENGSEYLQSIFDHPSIERLRAAAGLEGEELTKVVKEHAGTALKYATETAHLIVFLLVGFVLAIIYLFERDQIDAWSSKMSPVSIHGTLVRWFGYVGDAIAITVRMQVVVAIVSAVVTMPILILLGLPHLPLLFVLILITGLIPVVGNVISGAVLCYVAYTEKGAWAVAVFLVTTFVLHKIESYYLNPRLASQHVKLPSLVLVISLLLCEQAFGFVGLFLSFPALYIASRVAYEWREESGGHRPGALEPLESPASFLMTEEVAAEPANVNALPDPEEPAPEDPEAPPADSAEQPIASQPPEGEAPRDEPPAAEAPAADKRS